MNLAILEQRLEPFDLDIDDRRHVARREAVEQDHFVETIEELGAEMAAHDLHHFILDGG